MDKTIGDVIREWEDARLAKFLEEVARDDAPWMKWFDKIYCQKCPVVTGKAVINGAERVMEYSWCESHDGLCYFGTEDKAFNDTAQIIGEWLDQPAAELAQD